MIGATIRPPPSLRVLDLFSGIGGFSLGLDAAGMTTVAFCEIDPYCRRVLAKHWPDVPIHDDIKTLRGDEYGSVDIVCGGFPCQPFSTAGKRTGKEDARDLWPEMFRVIQAARPRWVIGENVAGFINMEFERTATDLESEGYTVQAFNIPASALDAPHDRQRLWIVAYAEGERFAEAGNDSQRQAEWLACRDIISDPERFGCSEVVIEDGGREDRIGKSSSPLQFSFDGRRARWREPEPRIRGIAHGIPNRVDRLRTLGNAVVPHIPYVLGKYILAVENMMLKF